MRYFLIMTFGRLLGLRDRLRCPCCGAVGTYKPHGGWLDWPRGDMNDLRWLCKWCGFYKNRNYDGQYAAMTCVVDPKAGCWRPRDQASKGSMTVPELLATTKFKKTWPWRG